jgi:hypothetical protein
MFFNFLLLYLRLRILNINDGIHGLIDVFVIHLGINIYKMEE